MDERLKNLKRAMKNNTFSHVEFTEEQRGSILEKMQPDIEPEMFALLTERKTATELIQLLHVKGIQAIWKNEGLIFEKLHEAEADGIVEGIWSECGEKSYRLTKKGLKKYVGQAETVRDSWSLKQLFHEVTTYES